MFGNKIFGSTKSNPAARQRPMLPPEVASHSSLEQDPVFLEPDVEIVQRYKLIPARVVQLVPNNKHRDLGPHTERGNIYLHLAVFSPQDRKMARVSNPSPSKCSLLEEDKKICALPFCKVLLRGFLSDIPEAVFDTLDKDSTILICQDQSGEGSPTIRCRNVIAFICCNSNSRNILEQNRLFLAPAIGVLAGSASFRLVLRNLSFSHSFRSAGNVLNHSKLNPVVDRKGRKPHDGDPK